VAVEFLRILLSRFACSWCNTGTCPALLLVLKKACGCGGLSDVAGQWLSAGPLWSECDDADFDAEETDRGNDVSDDVAFDHRACARALLGALRMRWFHAGVEDVVNVNECWFSRFRRAPGDRGRPRRHRRERQTSQDCNGEMRAVEDDF
jgi:hypothetical protein